MVASLSPCAICAAPSRLHVQRALSAGPLLVLLVLLLMIHEPHATLTCRPQWKLQGPGCSSDGRTTASHCPSHTPSRMLPWIVGIRGGDTAGPATLSRGLSADLAADVPKQFARDRHADALQCWRMVADC